MSDQALLDTFRLSLRHIAATVYAITTGHGGERFGIIATAVNSLSFDPPSLLVCVNHSASLHDPLQTAEMFCVNVLGIGNRGVADCFAKGGSERFAVGEWEEELGVPVLASAQSSLICRVARRETFGTHTIFIGELVAARHRANAKPLTYYDGRYIDITEAPDQ
ncbi:MAG: flavin reductase family protein [Candidatus Andeanibacterium colombiense]|uniref:Flavin reductase family protein n=1 Tax=Candidatus Andeanibacterium colombiense TaxID=3121345 RepID=A0AAJ5X9G6_9SPHN|nr:MAG: flavin reductase family protein [Sphingomonadaceae bacterium]